MATAGDQYEYATHNLWDLCARGDAKAATSALRRGIDVNVRNKIGWTPLHAACFGGHAKVLTLLIERGADLDATDNGGRTAVHEACKSGSLAALKCLHRAGAPLAAADNKGVRPSDVAAGEAVRKYMQQHVGDSTSAGAAVGGEAVEADVRAASKGRSFVRGDDGCARSVRRIRYSTKQKKELIKERRRKQREASAEEQGHGDGQPGGGAESDTWRSSVKGGRARGAGLGAVGWHHREALESTAPLDFGLARGRLDGCAVQLAASEVEAGCSPNAHVDIPWKPDWEGHASTAEELHEMEAAAFAAWQAELEARWPPHALNNFERSLDRWRKLWIAAEKADVCVVAVDARYPLLHLAPGMYAYLHGKLGKPLVLAMTHGELAPRAALAAWAAYLRDAYPGLAAVCVVDTASRDAAAAEGLLGCVSRAAGRAEAAASEGPLHVAVMGDSNVGKSSLVNFLMQRKAVAVSANPNTTKALQTHQLARPGGAAPVAVLYDCPAATAPRVGVPPPLEVLFGGYPLSQCPDPYSVLRFYAERCGPALIEMYQLPPGPELVPSEQQGDTSEALHGGSDPERSDGGGQEDEGEGEGEGEKVPPRSSTAGAASSWSPFSMAAAVAAKHKWFLRRRGEPDAFRGANHILRNAICGKPAPLVYWPPGWDGSQRGHLPQDGLGIFGLDAPTP